jgi:glucose/mannose-6-phosphate isomerase
MFLDQMEAFQELDPQNMQGEIDDLPGQLERAWELGQRLDLETPAETQNVLIAGMGGSAIGGDLLAAYAHPLSPVPIVVHRDYDLPSWARGPQTWVIANSHSGDTEETLSAFEAAVAGGARAMAITTGGKLARAAKEAGATLWQFEHQGQPRAAVGYSFGLLLAALTRLGLIPNPADELHNATSDMRAQQERIRSDVPTVQNPAKRMAGQLMGRWVSVFGSGILAPVARRWKTQISEIAKAWAQFETLPEANHNTLAGIFNPEEMFARTMVLFLKGSQTHLRNQIRAELTRKTFMLQGLNTDFIQAQGESRLGQQWTTLHFGDYVSFYLAMAYGVDPTPVEAIEGFKREMKGAG